MSHPTPPPDRPTPAGADSNLRQRMQDALAQPCAREQPSVQQQDALQFRVMAQWRQHAAFATTVNGPPAASLRRALTKRPLQMGLASLALVAVVGLADRMAARRPGVGRTDGTRCVVVDYAGRALNRPDRSLRRRWTKAKVAAAC